jgi:oxygen-independent coproporphyrinogen-3 oxidase
MVLGSMSLMDYVPITPELLARYDVPGPRYTSYPTVPAWQAPFGAAEYRDALCALAGLDQDPVSLYVHLPFCGYRCHYCACTVTVATRTAVVDRYLDRVERELELVTGTLGLGRRAIQLHLGGGTPNLLTVGQLERLGEMLERHFTFASGAERSVEADPRYVGVEQLAALRRLGFQRISYGVQDLDPVVQAAIGRIQPGAVVREAVELAREAGFGGVNIDLVYGLPEQTSARFARTLEAVVALAPDRVACYSYAHVPQVRSNQRLIDVGALPSPGEKFQLFRMAVDAFTGGGYEWLGMDHFARPADDLVLAARERRLHRDFMGYTTRPAPHLLAFGMSAIGQVADRYVQNVPRTGEYQRVLDAGELPVERGHRLSADDRSRRRAILHLMCNLQLPHGLVPPQLEESHARLQPLAEDGLITRHGDGYEVTALGRYFLRNIAMALDAYLPRQLAAGRPMFSRTV